MMLRMVLIDIVVAMVWLLIFRHMYIAISLVILRRSHQSMLVLVPIL